MRPNALFRAFSSFEKGVASRKVRWIYGLACGRRRTDWYAALVFLVPCSLCFTVFVWPWVLPSDLIEGVYRQTSTSARTCATIMESTVAPVVAEQYEYNRAKCLERGVCPSPEDMGTLICQQTDACGADPVEAARILDMLIDIAAQQDALNASDANDRVSTGVLLSGRRLLQLEGVLGLITENAGDAVPSDAADMEQTLAEASSPCAGCKLLAAEVFKEAAEGSPDKRWVEAMVRVHGKEWCVRQSESVLPPYDPWATFRGITSWSHVGNTPADENFLVEGVTRYGGASSMRSDEVDNVTAWPPSANGASPGNATTTSFNPFVANATGNRNGTAPDPFPDPPVNEQLMTTLLDSSPQLGCPLTAAQQISKLKARRAGNPWPPPAPAPPSWSKHCLMNATKATYGFVGDISRVAGSFSLEFSILAPALVMSSVMIVNSTAMLMWVETGFVCCGLVVLLLTFVDNLIAVANTVACMDRTFLSLNVLHMSILLGALLSAVGLLGHRSVRGGSRWDDERGEWRDWMSFKMLKGPKQAKFNVKRVNIIVTGSANALASSAVQSLMPGLREAGKGAAKMLHKGARFAKRKRKGLLGSWMGKTGFPRVVEDFTQTLWMTKVLGRPPKPAHKKLASLHEEAEEEKKTQKTASGRNVTTASFGRSRVSFSSGASFFRRHLSLGSGGKSASFSSEKLGAPSFGERRPKDGAEAVFVKRDVTTLMALWRDGVNRLMQVRASARLIELTDDGTLDWHSSAIPEHKIAFTARLRMNFIGTLFVAGVCTLIAAQQARKFMELLRWSLVARWCSWRAIGIKDFSLIDDIATGICVSLPILTFLLVLGQLIALTNAYRADIAALRRGEPVFTKKQRDASEISTGSEWLGYQLVTSGMTYFVAIVVLGVMSFGLAIPIIAIVSVNKSLRGKVLAAIFVVVVAWFSGIIVGVVYRRAHIKIFTEPRLNVLRYVHWFQFSDYMMLYITMQRSFVVVLIRIGVSIVLQAACIMRSDMTFFPLMVGKRVDKPHMAYVSVVLNDQKYSCPIVFCFYEALRDAGRANGEARLAAEKRVRAGGKLTGSNVRVLDANDLAAPPSIGKSPSSIPIDATLDGSRKSRPTRVAAMGRSMKRAMLKRLQFYDLFSGSNRADMSPEQRELLASEIDALRRRRRARTRWFLAITLVNNPSLIAMRAPWGGKPTNLALLKPSHLPHNIKEGWLRRRGGILGVVNNDYVVLTSGVLFIFEHASARNPIVYHLSSRVLIRRVFVSVSNQAVGGWNYPSDRYEPSIEELEAELNEEAASEAEKGKKVAGRVLSRAPSDKREDKRARRRREEAERKARKEEERLRREEEKTRKSPSFVVKEKDVVPERRSEDVAAGGGGDGGAEGDKGKEKTWRTKPKHFFVVTIPGGPIQVFASDDLEEVKDWVDVLRATCVNATERRVLDALKED